MKQSHDSSDDYKFPVTASETLSKKTAVSLSIDSETNAHTAGVMPSSACLTRASKDLYDSMRFCHYRLCPKGSLAPTKTESSLQSLSRNMARYDIL